MEQAAVEPTQARLRRRPAGQAEAQASASPVTLAPQAVADARSTAEVQHDTALEYDSIVLLSTLEQLYIRLSDNPAAATTPLALEHLVNLTNRLVDFTEKLPCARSRQFSLEGLITRGRRHYSQLGLKHVRTGRLSFAAFAALHLQHGGLRHPNTFQQLGQDLLQVINVCLNICVKAFYDPAMRQQWRTVYSGFLVNLSRTVQKRYVPPLNEREA